MSHIPVPIAIANGGTASTTASAARTALGVAVGTDVQAYDADLAAIAGLTSAADKIPYFTGSGTASVADFTAAARSILDDTSTAAIATTLGLGTGSSPTFTGVTATGDVSITGNLTVSGTKTTVAGEKTAFADNYLDLNANYTADAAQSCGFVASYDPTTTTSAVAGAGFVAGVASTSNPTVEVANTTGFGAGDVIRVQGSTSNDGFYEVHALLATPARLQIKGVGTAAAVEAWSMNQFTTEAAAGNVFKVAVSILRAGTDGTWETGAGSTVPITYTDIAASDAELAAIAGLTSAADKLPYFTGSGTAALADLTSFARTLLDDANQAAARATLGLTPGTDVQTQDATLTALAAYNTNGILTQTAADTFAGRTLTGTANQVSISNGDGVAGNPTFSTPQDIHTGATPTFAGLSLTGQFLAPITTKTGAYTLTASDFCVLADATTAGFTLTLPTAASIAGRIYHIKKIDASANAVVIDGAAAETIDGAATVSISAQNQSYQIISDGTNWRVL